jgi:hypothetical protein
VKLTVSSFASLPIKRDLTLVCVLFLLYVSLVTP